jgi:hypothetical protein
MEPAHRFTLTDTQVNFAPFVVDTSHRHEESEAAPWYTKAAKMDLSKNFVPELKHAYLFPREETMLSWNYRYLLSRVCRVGGSRHGGNKQPPWANNIEGDA